MKVLVTGANGHIGANVVRSLLRDGHDVRGSIRPTADMRSIEGLDIELVHADVMDANALIGAANGCDAIIHLAAVYKTVAKTVEEIIEPAVTGARNIMQAAKENGIKRIVYTSSVASIGSSNSPDKLRTTEDWNEDATHAYYIAKRDSEIAARKLAKEADIELIIICPTAVLGSNDYRPTPSNQLIIDLINGIGTTFPGGLNFVDVHYVADIHVAALTKGEPGKRYIASGDNIENKELGQLIKKLTNIKPLHITLPKGMMKLSASLTEKACILMNKRPPFTKELVEEQVNLYTFVDDSDTRATFELVSPSAEQTITDAIKWYAAQNLIKQKALKKIPEMLFSS